MVGASTPVILATRSTGVLFQSPGPEPVAADGGLAQVVLVGQAVAPEDVHQAERQGRVSAGPGLDVPVASRGGWAAVGVDRHQGRPALAGLDHQAPEVAIGVRGVRAPVEDQLAAGHGHRVGPRSAEAVRIFVAQGPGRGADGPVEGRGPQAVEESAVEAAGLELAHRPVIAVGQDGLGTVFRGRDGGESPGDLGQGVVPRDRLEPARTLRPDPAGGGWSSRSGL